MNAAARWRRALEARGIPQALIDAAPASPWGFPREVFEARAARSTQADPGETPTAARALEALPDGGTVLDVGVGGGATSLPLAGRAGTIIGVDAEADMLEAFITTGGGVGVATTAIEGRWPEIEGRVPEADVVTSGHTIYNVPELGAFVSALDGHARHRVVLEATDRHPLGWMTDLWRTFHDLDIPDEPRIELAIDVLRGIGIDPHRRDRSGDDDPGGGFTTKEAAIALVRTRLCLTPDHDAAIAERLGTRLRRWDGRWSAGPSGRAVVTLWWDPQR